MLNWFPRLQVATACFSCSPPELSFLDPYFISMYKHYNHCQRETAHLQLNIVLLLLLFRHSTNIWRGVPIIQLLIMQSSPLPCHLVPLGPKCLPQSPVVEHYQPTLVLPCERPSSMPMENNRQTYSSLRLDLYIFV